MEKNYLGACAVLENYLNGAMYDLENGNTGATDMIYDCIMALKTLGDYGSYSDFWLRYKKVVGKKGKKKIKFMTLEEFLLNYSNNNIDNEYVKRAYEGIYYLYQINPRQANQVWEITKSDPEFKTYVGEVELGVE